ncbi:carbamoyl phosphate synthase small subunit [Clostridium sp. Marseille-P299]|uniref:carbamoyl phosphate synthase small subunit n=1 Tax=Clostridium sp. Marseille-P299 TaxID=1805477 RepID=UPI000832357D|nr:carbamoyl phosphate synthase small subunit [Clostridium sp. Marseille-P299]
MKAYLILEDGHVFSGSSIGSTKEVISEIVFNTSMTGYLEILTDPSYAGQAVVMTYPLIGNYGVSHSDMESTKAWPDGFIVREVSRVPSNFRSEVSIDTFLKENDIPGIAGIDTRMLTKVLREHGTMNGMITTNENFNLEEVIGRLKDYTVTGVVNKVTCKEKTVTTPDAFKPTDFELAKMTYMATGAMKKAIEHAKENGVCDGEIALASVKGAEGVEWLNKISDNPELVQKHYKVALMDFGSKRNIEHCLLKRGCEVTVYPASTSAEEILASHPDGIMLSNGPGDPAECVEIIAEIKKLSESGVPIFAICLGHQLMALAHGFKTTKLKYGHRGANHPVKDLETGRVYLSSQNHGYVVVEDSIDKEVAKVRFINANDKTIEGLSYNNKNIYTVQFHPEACAGPQDSEFLFDEFIKMMEVNA